MMQLNIPDRDYLNSGHVGCPGCGATIAMKLALRVLGEKTVVVIPACCWSIIAGNYPQSALKVPILHTAFATTAAAASGVRAALDMKGDTETTVVGWAGDGGTFDIGFQALSGAVERQEDFIYVCYDNEAYMNTGVQRSSSTPYGTRTTTTPGTEWKKTRKKNIVEALAAHRISYTATASIAFPDDMMRKFKKAMEMKGGPRFIHVFASCPTGWGVASELSIKIARLAVQTNMFPLYEVEDGVKYTLNYKGNRSIDEYLKMQSRFKHLTEEDIQTIQEMVNEDWQLLLRKIGP
ncbi:MAG: 3-methyl-2-oxobutanoate dehydrogenase subunit beta [Desulfobacterales bacterium]|nr:3-methyl-2-oxobutanoate dehydrogenase subunit beta [Desulfobacterales bacterium]